MSLARLRARRTRVGADAQEDGAGPSLQTTHRERPARDVRGGGGRDVEVEDRDDDELPTAAAITASAKGKSRALPRNEDDDEDDVFSEDLDDSADEWHPAPKPSKPSALGSLKRSRTDDRDVSEDDDASVIDDEDDFAAASGRKKAKSSRPPSKNIAGGEKKNASSSSLPAWNGTINPASSKSKLASTAPGGVRTTNVQGTLPAGSTPTGPPSLGRAAGLAALAKGSNLSAKEIIDRLHRARAMAENDFRRERGEAVLEDEPSPSSSPSKAVERPTAAKSGDRERQGTTDASSAQSLSRVDVSTSSHVDQKALLHRPQQPAPKPPAVAAPGPPPPMSVASWLGVVPSEADLPWPTITPEAAMIQDRESLFVAYVFPLPPSPSNTASTLPRLIATYASHLIRAVQPASTPKHLLPGHLQSVPPHKRGAMHDMYAARTRILKAGRDGSRGWLDWTGWESNDDDGEKWGSQKIARVLQEEGVNDVLVFVSRWYGGTLLGPARFTHITDVTRTTVRLHVSNEKVDNLRTQLEELDTRAATLRSKLASTSGTDPPPPSSSAGAGTGASSTSAAGVYSELTEAKAQRLLVARQKMVELLEKKLEKQRGAANAGDPEAGAAAPETATPAAGAPKGS